MQATKEFTTFALFNQVGNNDRDTQPTMYLSGTNEEVRNYNPLIFDALGDSDDQDCLAYDIVIGARSQADRNNIQAKTGPDANPRDVKKRLAQNLRLKVEGEYIISRNVKVTVSLGNGAGCILKR